MLSVYLHATEVLQLAMFSSIKGTENLVREWELVLWEQDLLGSLN